MTRRDSTSETISTTIKIFNQTRQKTLNTQAAHHLTTSVVPSQSGLQLPQRKHRPITKKSPIIVRIDNFDTGSCYEGDDNRLSPLLQSPESDTVHSEGSRNGNCFESSNFLGTQIPQAKTGYGGLLSEDSRPLDMRDVLIQLEDLRKDAISRFDWDLALLSTKQEEKYELEDASVDATNKKADIDFLDKNEESVPLIDYKIKKAEQSLPENSGSFKILKGKGKNNSVPKKAELYEKDKISPVSESETSAKSIVKYKNEQISNSKKKKKLSDVIIDKSKLEENDVTKLNSKKIFSSTSSQRLKRKIRSEKRQVLKHEVKTASENLQENLPTSGIRMKNRKPFEVSSAPEKHKINKQFLDSPHESKTNKRKENILERKETKDEMKKLWMEKVPENDRDKEKSKTFRSRSSSPIKIVRKKVDKTEISKNFPFLQDSTTRRRYPDPYLFIQKRSRSLGPPSLPSASGYDQLEMLREKHSFASKGTSIPVREIFPQPFQRHSATEKKFFSEKHSTHSLKEKKLPYPMSKNPSCLQKQTLAMPSPTESTML